MLPWESDKLPQDDREAAPNSKTLTPKDASQNRDLQLFLELFGEPNDLPCEFGDRPDLVVTKGQKQIGIEHTRLYNEQAELPSGQQLRPQERIHFQITQRASELFQEKCSIPLYLTVDFAEPYNYRRRDIEEVAGALSLAVQWSLGLKPQSLEEGHDTWVYAWEFQTRKLPFPQGVASFHYSRVAPNRGFELWGPTCAYFVPHLAASDIESVIERKEKLLESYLARCEYCWLLIATDAGWRSSHFDIPSEVIEHQYTSQFEKVFLMAITHRNLTELSISHGGRVGTKL